MLELNPQSVFEALLPKMKTKRSIKSLNAINDVCREHKEAGSTDFNLATIVRLGANRGVPTERTIKNSTGEAYRALITAWQDTVPKKQINKRGAYDWISEISDSRLRFLVEDLVAKKNKLEKEIREYSGLVLNIDMRESKSEQSVPQLIDSEWEALRAAIDNDFIKKMGWQVDPRGRVKDVNSNTIYGPGYVTAIEKLISLKAI
ncbi:MAG TPA: gamma-mobile-trio protein GmtX [Thiopseudomonas sp.]|nr:gamma-mobile-trio protein GmtX [Thiopseudomonas sp.]